MTEQKEELLELVHKLNTLNS